MLQVVAWSFTGCRGTFAEGGEQAMFGLGPVEIVVIGAVAVMLYGKRLPEVG